MTAYQPTEIEVACGVTSEDVVRVRAQSLVRLTHDGMRVVLPVGTPPALCGAVVKVALGVPGEFRGFNSLGHPVYGPAESVM